MKDNGLATGGTGVDTEVGTHDIQISVLAQANTPPNSIPYTRTINEDTPYVFHLGTPTSDPSVSDFTFSDAQNNNLKTVKIALAAPIVGRLQLNGVDVTDFSNFVVSAADIKAGGLIYFPEPNNMFGPVFARFTFAVQDDGGTATIGGVQGADTDTSPDTLTIAVNGVNDPPLGLNNTVTGNEDQAKALHASDFPMTDQRSTATPARWPPSASPACPPAARCSSPARRSASAISSRPPVRPAWPPTPSPSSPMPNVNGSPLTSFLFQVQDNGGTANNGVDLDPASATLTINVQPVNDPPTGNNATLTALEDTALGFTAANFGFFDPQDQVPPSSVNPHNLQTVIITSLPTGGGKLFVGGTELTAANLATLGRVSTATSAS